jgi:hypothetical protein
LPWRQWHQQQQRCHENKTSKHHGLRRKCHNITTVVQQRVVLKSGTILSYETTMIAGIWKLLEEMMRDATWLWISGLVCRFCTIRHFDKSRRQFGTRSTYEMIRCWNVVVPWHAMKFCIPAKIPNTVSYTIQKT